MTKRQWFDKNYKFTNKNFILPNTVLTKQFDKLKLDAKHDRTWFCSFRHQMQCCIYTSFFSSDYSTSDLNFLALVKGFLSWAYNACSAVIVEWCASCLNNLMRTWTKICRIDGLFFRTIKYINSQNFKNYENYTSSWQWIEICYHEFLKASNFSMETIKKLTNFALTRYDMKKLIEHLHSRGLQPSKFIVTKVFPTGLV